LGPIVISKRCREATPFPVISWRDLLVLWRVTARRLVNWWFLSRQVMAERVGIQSRARNFSVRSYRGGQAPS